MSAAPSILSFQVCVTDKDWLPTWPFALDEQHPVCWRPATCWSCTFKAACLVTQWPLAGSGELSLPDEVRELVLRGLQGRDLSNTRQSCKQLARVAAYATRRLILKRLAQRDLSRYLPVFPSWSWDVQCRGAALTLSQG